jgi:hypothetical protein
MKKKVTIVTTIITVIIKNENLNVNTTTNNHNLQQTEIKSKYIHIYFDHLKLNFTFLLTDVNFSLTTLLKFGVLWSHATKTFYIERSES